MLDKQVLENFSKNEIFHHRIEILRKTIKFCHSEKLTVLVIDKKKPGFSLIFKRSKKEIDFLLKYSKKDLVLNKKWFKAIVVKTYTSSKTILEFSLYDNEFKFLTKWRQEILTYNE